MVSAVVVLKLVEAGECGFGDFEMADGTDDTQVLGKFVGHASHAKVGIDYVVEPDGIESLSSIKVMVEYVVGFVVVVLVN